MDELDGRTSGFVKRTKQREAILRILAEQAGFVSAQTLHAKLRTAGQRIGLTTVYRTLRTLADVGMVDIVRESPQQAISVQLFRARPLGGHHHYLVCRQCGNSAAVTSTAVEEWADSVGREHDFTEVQHVIELSGICADCRPRP